MTLEDVLEIEADIKYLVFKYAEKLVQFDPETLKTVAEKSKEHGNTVLDDIQLLDILEE